MNVSLLKVISILSSFLGVICGFVTLLPYIGGFAFFILMCCSSMFVILMLMRLNILSLESVPESITIGGIVGFISYTAFSVVYIPLVLLLLKLFKYSANYGVALMLENSNLFVTIILSLFLAVISASINAFTAFLIYYVTDMFRNMNSK